MTNNTDLAICYHRADHCGATAGSPCTATPGYYGSAARKARRLAWNKARIQAAREGRLPSEVLAEQARP